MNVKSKQKKTEQTHSYLGTCKTMRTMLVWFILMHCLDLFSPRSVRAQELDDHLQTESAGTFSAGQNQLSLGGGSSVVAESNSRRHVSRENQVVAL